MRTKVTLALLFLNAVLFVFIFRVERAWRTGEAALEVRRRVLTTEAADIRSIEVSGGPSSFRLERRGDRWFLTRPFEWPANPNAVSRMINDLRFLESDTSFSVSDVLKNNLSLADYGLDHPKLTVTLTSGGPDTTGQPPVTTLLRIGNAATDGQSLYLLSADGTRIHVVGRELADSLTPALDQLRSDSVLTIPVFEARLLSLRTRAAAGLHVQLSREGNRWLFEAPIPTAADKNATELAINGLDALRVGRFVPADPGAPLPSADPTVQVAIEGDNRRETLFIGQPVQPGAAPAGEREYYAQLEGREACFTVAVPNSLMDTLGNAQEALRDRHVLPDLDPSAVTTVILSAPNQPDLTLQRLESPAGLPAGTGWQIVLPGSAGQGPRTQAADPGAVARLLERLARLTARGFQSDAPQTADLENWGFNRPARVIRLELSPAALPGGSTPAAAQPPSEIILQIGLEARREDLAYARLATGLSVYSISPDILEQTPMAPRAWRDRRLSFLPAAGAITALRLTDLSTNRPVLQWSAPDPAPPSLQRLLGSLRDLQAESFLQDHFSETVPDAGGQERPWRYRLDATLSLPSGAGGEQTRTATLWLGERLGGTEQYAGSRELNAVFAISQPMIDSLWALTYGRRDPGPRP